jgi:molybdate transport system substrate-binding protein
LSVLERVFLAVLYVAVAGLILKTSAGQQARELRVAAAADLASAMGKLGPSFEKQTGIQVTVSLGSSGNFFAQIQNGAPFDVFLSADKSYPEKLEQAGKTEGPVSPYARGQLVIWVPSSSSLKFPSNSNQVLDGDLNALTGPAVQKIAIANPAHAPYGKAAVSALEHFGVYDRVKSKLVMGENISQTAEFAQSGNADVALIALSLAAAGSLQREGRWVLLPEHSYPPIEQEGVALKSSPNKVQARQFLDFLTSPTGQAILHDFGFGKPGFEKPGSGAPAK